MEERRKKEEAGEETGETERQDKIKEGRATNGLNLMILVG